MNPSNSPVARLRAIKAVIAQQPPSVSMTADLSVSAPNIAETAAPAETLWQETVAAENHLRNATAHSTIIPSNSTAITIHSANSTGVS